MDKLREEQHGKWIPCFKHYLSAFLIAILIIFFIDAFTNTIKQPRWGDAIYYIDMAESGIVNSRS